MRKKRARTRRRRSVENKPPSPWKKNGSGLFMAFGVTAAAKDERRRRARGKTGEINKSPAWSLTEPFKSDNLGAAEPCG